MSASPDVPDTQPSAEIASQAQQPTTPAPAADGGNSLAAPETAPDASREQAIATADGGNDLAAQETAPNDGDQATAAANGGKRLAAPEAADGQPAELHPAADSSEHSTALTPAAESGAASVLVHSDRGLGAPVLDADGGEEPAPVPEERASRARIVAQLCDDAIRQELEVNLGATTESNLYVDVDLRVANGGVFVATYQDLAPGTHVSLQITLAGGLATSAHGRVTLKRDSLEAFRDPPPGLCVAFETLSNEALTLLERFTSIRTPWLIADE